jgi:hypothetical protein
MTILNHDNSESRRIPNHDNSESLKARNHSNVPNLSHHRIPQAWLKPGVGRRQSRRRSARPSGSTMTARHGGSTATESCRRTEAPPSESRIGELAVCEDASVASARRSLKHTPPPNKQDLFHSCLLELRALALRFAAHFI